MVKLTRKSTILLFSLLFLILFPWGAEALGEPYFISLFSRCLIYGLAAVSLDLILGYGGMVSFGHAAFFGIGAYTTGILAFHHTEELPLWNWLFTFTGTENAFLAWPLAVLASAFFSVLIGFICLRTTGIFFIMITLAFAQMLFYFFVSLEKYGGDDGLNFWGNSLPGVNFNNDFHFYYLCLFFLLSFLYLCYRLVNSRFGMVIRACKQNELRMQSLGIPTFRYKLVCFAIAGAGAGLAGALIANKTQFVSPHLLQWSQSGEILIMVLLGGAGTLFGPVWGAITFLLAEEFLSTYTEHWMVYFGPFLLLIVLFTKRGIYGLLVGKEGRDG